MEYVTIWYVQGSFAFFVTYCMLSYFLNIQIAQNYCAYCTEIDKEEPNHYAAKGYLLRIIIFAAMFFASIAVAFLLPFLRSYYFTMVAGLAMGMLLSLTAFGSGVDEYYKASLEKYTELQEKRGEKSTKNARYLGGTAIGVLFFVVFISLCIVGTLVVFYFVVIQRGREQRAP